MRNYQNIALRRFTVQIRDNRTGETYQDCVVVSKVQLHAAQLCGQSSREVIDRIYSKRGFSVLGIIGKAEKREIPLDLEGIFNEVVI